MRTGTILCSLSAVGMFIGFMIFANSFGNNFANPREIGIAWAIFFPSLFVIMAYTIRAWRRWLRG